MQGWYSVRRVFRSDRAEDSQSRRSFEERVVLLRAVSFEDALAKGEVEAKRYIPDSPRYHTLDHLAAYYIHSDESLRDGDEVWSCVRDLNVTDDQFLKKVFEGEIESLTNVTRRKPDT
ncbi:MAG: DUF4288 domain-containing protein [Verrucomicrobia bacterium]|nr:DUF4288 domain-containing protein [Verrucomicrobiota bacterium]NBU09588.1 DUF4288 domain-containing protein [Pseudomonadota bacterium]NDA67015.1 DUF4288 domain-containing protein [Verrucomicrobiota bacterium]NDB75073.1 DUF4288 domain-containing protein [Verrucomicrobiota bacterium]NDD38893.1 DUF4288 domain-containing protein [Verrucomicrobiota bacterium]